MTLVAGVDEAGRGPWAGPVVVAAVILDPNKPINGLDDSKKLSAKKRDDLYDKVIDNAISYSFKFIQVPLIDRMNILAATLYGMQLSVSGLDTKPSEVLVDGRDLPKIPYKGRAIIGGDAKEQSIAAASIVAKVQRDRYMMKLGDKYPEYGFSSHKGYGTKIHQEALHKYGVLIHHRKSFAPIRRMLQSNIQVVTS
jgi:ribonuclease HII